MSEFVKETSEYVEMSDSITLCIVKDGAAGTSLNMKTGVSSIGTLPTSGMNTGDSYIIDGHLWTYTGTTVNDSAHHNGFTDCGKVSGEAGKSNYVHIAWSNKQSPKKEDDVVLSNTDGNAYAYMGTWVSETKDDTAAEAVKLAKWVYVKGDKGDTPEIAKLRVDHSVCHFSRTSNSWDYSSVTVSIVIMNGGETEIPAYGDTTKYFWRLSTDDTSTKRSSGMGFSASLTASSITVNLYKTGSDENVAIDTITVPMVFDGMDGDGTPGVSYRLVPMSDRSATVKVSNSSTNATFALHYTLHYKAVKMVGDSSESATIATIAATIENKDVTTTVNNTEGTLSGTGTESYTSDNRPADSIPVTVTLSDGTVLYDNVPVTMEAGVAVDINEKLGKITTTLTDPNGDFNTIKNTANSNSARISTLDGRVTTVEQTANNISLKVQEVERKSRNLVSGGNVVGLYNKQYEVLRSSAFKMEQGKTYTVTARLWMESASNGHYVRIYAIGADNSWDPAPYSPVGFTNTSSSVVRFKFEAPVTKQMVIGIYEMDSSGGIPVDGNYYGVHVDWVRVDEGDWTGLDAKGETDPNGRLLDAWTPSEEEIDAVNLLPDPDFSEAIGYCDGMGERNTFRSHMGDSVSWMSRDSSTDGDGCHGVTFERSGYSDPKGANSDSYAGLRYIVPFRGAGTYCISFVYTDLSQTSSGKPDMDDIIYMELHPCDANKSQITNNGTATGGMNDKSTNIGIIRAQNYKTFGETAMDNSGNVKKIAYLEVRVFLRSNGSVRVSRLCLSKSDHFIYWNANELSEARKKDAAQLATGIDIYSHKIIATTDNFTVRNNSGVTTFSVDKDGNIVGAGDAMFKGAVTATTFTLSSDKFYVDNNGKFKLSTTYFSVDETGKINATGGNISFFTFDGAGMYSGSLEQDGKIYSGLGMSMNNLSVSGNTNMRLSSVFLGSGWKDSRYTNSDNYFVHRVGSAYLASTFYNYIKLERIGPGPFTFENDPEHAALGIETEGDFCLAALGGPSQFAGMCFASASGGTLTGGRTHLFYLCSGGTFTMPSDPPDGMLIIVIQTGSRITFNGNGHQFRSGTKYSNTCNSNSAGQWTMFYFDGSYWNTVYVNGRPW